MSLSTMSPKDRRAMMLGLGVLVPALLFIYGVKPLLASLKTARQDVVEQRGLLANEEAAVAAAKRNPDMQRIADSAMKAMTPRLFEGKDDVMATAALLTHIGELAKGSNVNIQSSQTKGMTFNNGVRSLHVDIRAESDLTGALAFLESLEVGEKLLKVERIDISKSLAAAADKGVEPVSIMATIVGYAIADPSAPPPSKKVAPGLPGAGGRGQSGIPQRGGR